MLDARIRRLERKMERRMQNTEPIESILFVVYEFALFLSTLE
jgi:hypothetical protein